MLDDLHPHCPGEVPFQAHECAVDRGGLEPEIHLQIGSVTNKQWGGNCLWRKGLFVLSLPPVVLAPCHELAQITQVVADRDRCEVFHLLERMCVLLKSQLSLNG